MKIRMLTILVMVIFLSSCIGQPTQPTAPTAAVPATQPPATAAPTEPVEPSPAPTVASSTAAPTAVTGDGQPVTILSTHMTSAMEGWAVGVVADGTLQRILRTADGGQTWKDVTPADQAAKKGNTDLAVMAAYYGEYDAWALYFTPTPAEASEAVFVFHTADQGQTWEAGQPLDIDDLTREFFIPGELGFSDAQNGWLLVHLGAGMSHDYVTVYKTADGGMTWTRVVDPTSPSDTNLPMVCSKSGLTFIDAQTGWASGNCNGVVNETFLYGTRDGGANWNLVELPNPPGQAALLSSQENMCGTLGPDFVDDQNGALTVTCRAPDGSTTRWVYLTRDGGATWQPGERGTVNWTMPQFTQAGDHWVLEGAGSGEQPALFAPLFDRPTSPPVLELAAGDSGLDFADPLHGWAATWIETDQLNLLRTTDGGQTWQKLEPRLVP